MQFKPLAFIAVLVLKNEFKEESSDTMSVVTPVIGTNNLLQFNVQLGFK